MEGIILVIDYLQVVSQESKNPCRMKPDKIMRIYEYECMDQAYCHYRQINSKSKIALNLFLL